ncbi:hypothetical protein CANCADRAFT_179 [Tortispora caseinolytica NRRL Y-17796]|uniref:Phosphoadenosine phosphosulphate reductase domain-containing protein n=1 Tax=Tortispora caseinolytica NRRL Y-17796 TaxID=767744 RepID=A0A1E4TIQ7_9ASCO|nr:hypothetical protein CANCADRAFT_179 [Tortispora caseinolytica NRRL Y-17796]
MAFDESSVKQWNAELEGKTYDEILEWATKTFPDLYQTTAFGLTGLVITDALDKLYAEGRVARRVPLVFIDTLHHFNETLDLVDRVRSRYNSDLHVYKPAGVSTGQEFAAKYGKELWETDDLKYDYLVKVEPLRRAYEELNVKAVVTGRRRSQGAARSSLNVVELEPETGVVKINPLADWSFEMVKKYIDDNKVPYNALVDLGYKSIGDWHSTAPVDVGEDERSGRWKNKTKTECGIHVQSKFAEYLRSQ